MARVQHRARGSLWRELQQSLQKGEGETRVEVTPPLRGWGSYRIYHFRNFEDNRGNNYDLFLEITVFCRSPQAQT